MSIDPGIQFYMKVPLGDGTFTNGRIDYTTHPSALGIAELDLAGQRVLDVATNDGFWAFWAESRGAEDVLGVDVAGFDDYDWGYDGPEAWRRSYQRGYDFSHQWNHPGRRFGAIREHLASRARLEQASVYDLDPAILGQFDLVFNYGLLYHLRHPLLSLDRVRSVTRGALILESHVVNFLQEHPAHLFYERDEFREPTNWTGPTEAAVAAWLRSAGFRDIWVRRPRSDVRTGRTIFVAVIADSWREVFSATAGLVFLDAEYYESVRRLTQRCSGEGVVSASRRPTPVVPAGDAGAASEPTSRRAPAAPWPCAVNLQGQRVLSVGRQDAWLNWAADQGATDVEVVEIASLRGSTTWPGDGARGDEDHRGAGGTPGDAQFDSGVPAAPEARWEYDLGRSADAQFDLILHCGILHQLRYPLLSLDHVRTVCRGALILETLVISAFRELPLALHYWDPPLGPSGWTMPTEAMIGAWLRSAGFEDVWVDRRHPTGAGNGVVCFAASVSDGWSRRFEATPGLVKFDDAYLEHSRRMLRALVD